MSSCKNWIGDEFFDGDRLTQNVSMKPLLAVAIREAVSIAIVDSIPDIDDARRVELYRDIFKVADKEWGAIDPLALAQNVCCRLLGTGGWTIRGVYHGNATPREVFEASIPGPDVDPIAGIIEDLRGTGDAPE